MKNVNKIILDLIAALEENGHKAESMIFADNAPAEIFQDENGFYVIEEVI